jgi:hypothetical protein
MNRHIVMATLFYVVSIVVLLFGFYIFLKLVVFLKMLLLVVLGFLYLFQYFLAIF